MEFISNAPLMFELVPKIFPSMKIHVTFRAISTILNMKKKVQVFYLDLYGEYIRD